MTTTDARVSQKVKKKNKKGGKIFKKVLTYNK